MPRLPAEARSAPASGAAVTPGAPVPGDLIALGTLRGAYGLQGWSHVQPYSADAAVLRTVRQWWLQPPEHRGAVGQFPVQPLAVTGVRTQGSGLVAKWQGCDEPEAAQALKGCRVAVARGDFPRLPAGQFYWVDLIGMRVVNRAGEDLGDVRDLRSNGAHDILEVAAADAGAVRLIPMVAAYLDEVQVGQRCIRVDWSTDW